MLRTLCRPVHLVIRANSTAAQGLSNEMKQKINDMIKANDVVVFMKGTQQEPMCGFSRNVKLILDYHEVKFQEYNVLADQELREAIKLYSDWPTIPQVYVKGDFVGGCDIMVQMHKEGEISDFFDDKKIKNKYGNYKP